MCTHIHKYSFTPLHKLSKGLWRQLERRAHSVPSSVFCEDKKSLILTEADQADRSDLTTEKTMNFD